MSENSCLSIILAAGEGTRMKSTGPKVLKEIAGLAMINHVVGCVTRSGASDLAIVVGNGAEQVSAAVEQYAGDAATFVQTERLGTGHAVLAARDAIARGYETVLVMFGDTPLIDSEALTEARQKIADGAVVAVMGFHSEQPEGYGRLIVENGELAAIREHKDASEAERSITFCNGGLMALKGDGLLDLLDAIGNDNSKGEYYLTDIVEIAHSRGLKVVAVEASEESLLGVNNRAELAEAEAIWQRQRRMQAMLDGVTLIDPDTVYFSHDTVIGNDTVIEPNVFFGPGVTVGRNVRIRANCHIEGAKVEDGTEIGPFARLRPGADLRSGSKVGNFCEVKKAVVHEGAKVNHLTYIGDAVIGRNANIGAGTITCNYDGFGKHLTEIGANAFIGSNSALVAPVKIGNGAYVGSGSVVTDDVPDDDLAIGRARQVNKKGLAARLRARLRAAKEAKR